MWSGSNKGQSWSAVRTGLSSAPCAQQGRGGWQRRDAEREGGRKRKRERERGWRRAGLAGCGLKWQQIVLDHSNPFNSTGKLQLAHGEGKLSIQQQAKVAGVSERKREKPQHCNLDISNRSLSLTPSPTRSTLNLFV